MSTHFYYCFNKNEEIVKKSSSGGMFYTISKYFLNSKKNAKVYGCILDDQLNAMHVSVTSIEDINPLLGSKYIQSNLNKSFENIKKDLINNYSVLFSGTPCQVDALNKFLDSNLISKQNLLTIDFICHGVANNLFYKDYIKYLEKKYRSSAVSCSFRAKNKPGKLQDMRVTFANGKKYIASTTKYDWFYSAYHSNLIIKPACFKCPYTKLDRHSDFTLADAWGYKSNDCQSPSLVICNSQKANLLFNEILDEINYEETDLSTINNPQLFENIQMPDNYDQFNYIYSNEGFLAAEKFIGNNMLKTKLKVKFIDFIYKLELDKFLKK